MFFLIFPSPRARLRQSQGSEGHFASGQRDFIFFLYYSSLGLFFSPNNRTKLETNLRGKNLAIFPALVLV